MLYSRDHYDMADLSDEMAAELGVLTTHIVRHVQALPHISRAHVYRIGTELHTCTFRFFARPEGQAQLYGSWMPVWDDLLPEYPADVADADAGAVADAFGTSYGGPDARPPTNRCTSEASRFHQPVNDRVKAMGAGRHYDGARSRPRLFALSSSLSGRSCRICG